MVLGKFIRHYLDREPMVVVSCAIGAVAVSLPLVVVPIRRSMGLPTDQYDGPIILTPSRSRAATWRPPSSKSQDKHIAPAPYKTQEQHLFSGDYR